MARRGIGIVETFADVGRVTETREIPLEAGAARDEDVVVALFDDVWYLLDADGLVVVDVVLGSWRGLAEEAPFSYKDVDLVVATCEHAGLARRIARLRPIGVVKG